MPTQKKVKALFFREKAIMFFINFSMN